MKNQGLNLLAYLIIGIVFILHVSALPPGPPQYFTPVFMTRADLENSVRLHPEGRDLKNPGKIYLKAPYIFINEKYKGVHIIDNSNPVEPKKVGFVTAPGCLDIAVKGNILYLDNAVDLVAFDLNKKQVTQRIQNVFPEPVAPNNMSYSHSYWDRGQKNLIIVEWKSNN